MVVVVNNQGNIALPLLGRSGGSTSLSYPTAVFGVISSLGTSGSGKITGNLPTIRSAELWNLITKPKVVRILDEGSAMEIPSS